MTAMPPAPLFSPAYPVVPGWGASLHLQVARRADTSRLVAARHSGPLRLQRPFYPEGREHPHIYLLHPPGGMVPGDRLDIDVSVSAGAAALVTTPASGKVYDVGERALPQRQDVVATVAPGAVLEWLPQDTLFFNGARFSGTTTVHLQGDARLVLWEISTLGRRAGDFPFVEGSVTQRLSIYRDDKPLLLERMALDAGSPLLDAHCGLGGARSWGTLVATGQISKPLLEALREASAGHVPARVSVTALKALVVVRYLGECPFQAMQIFERLWSLLRPETVGREACAPRVWAT